MRRPSAVVDPLLVGLLAAAVSLGGAGRPSFWYDEAATISASYSRSVDQLWQMLGNVDAVHGLYYLLMHGWFTLVPPTEFWSRAPSGLAVGAAAAGVVVLGRQFSSRTVAVSAGIICGILPRATWAGIEARPYALSMMAAVWLTVLLVHAARRNLAWLWLSYGVVLAASILLDVYLALMLLAHAAFLCVYRDGRAVLVRFAITSVLAGGAVTPFVGADHRSGASDHLGLTDWPPDDRRRGGSAVLREKPAFHGRVGNHRGDGYCLVALHVRPTGTRGPATADGGDRMVCHTHRSDPQVVCAGSPDLHASLPVLHRAGDRTGSGRLHRRIGCDPMGSTAIVSVLALAAAPNYLLAQRSPYAKYGMDYSQVADLISAKARRATA